MDTALAILLLLVVPARALWRERTGRAATAEKATRYRATIALVGALVAVLAIDWVAAARPVGALGLGTPVTAPALAGLGVAAVLLVLLAVVARRQRDRPLQAASAARPALLPDTPAERRLFVLLAIAVGFGWELLYRGFLLFALAPRVGTIGAVVVAALAYAVAHGFRGRRAFAASLASAFVFTIGYAVTGSLWWLILLHTGLPLVGLMAGRAGDGPTS